METAEISNNNHTLDKGRFPFYQKGVIYGLIAGLSMGAFMLLVNSAINEIHTGWSFAKHLLLGAALGIILKEYREALPAGQIFRKGILLGAFTSFIASVTLLLINTFISLTGIDAITTHRYGLESDSIGNMLIINGALLFEGMVFGMILTFIWLQLLKDLKPAK